MGRPGKTDAFAQAVTDADAAHLRSQGKTYRQIAEAQGCDVKTAHDRVQRAIAAVPVEAVEEIRKVELERLDLMYQAALGVLKRKHVTVSNGRLIEDPSTGEPLDDDAPVLQAIASLIKIQERRARLLGLDAPTKTRHEVITRDAFVEAMSDLEAEVASLEAQAVGGGDA